MKVLGVDFGTSSVKLLCSDGVRHWAAQASYRQADGDGFFDALILACRMLAQQTCLSDIDSIGLSGQTGSYILRAKRETLYLSWQDPGREPYVQAALDALPPSQYLRAIGMCHPRLASYPLPTLLYLSHTHSGLLPDLRIDQPKDYIMERLCGQRITDVYSWRGLVHPKTRRYAPELLDIAGVKESQFPEIAPYGRLNAESARLLGLREGVLVHTGINDFYAGLIGLGIERAGQCFDATGTSEHFGVMTEECVETPLVSSPYPGGAVHYGVTASSGVALSWGRMQWTMENPPFDPRAPIFLPYLNGERAPVFDEHAVGMFYGITGASNAESMMYSVLEGVSFALYDIYTCMQCPPIHEILVTGGAGQNRMLNLLKASLFGVPLQVYNVPSGSALGALILAGGSCPREENVIAPEDAWTNILRKRFETYQKLYPAQQMIRTGC